MRLTDHDAGFLYGETASGPMHGGSICVIEGELPFEKVFAHFESRLHLVPRYRQRLAYVPFNMAHPKWVDDPQFDLANHLVHEVLPPGTSLEAAIDRAVAVAEPLMPRDRPLWKAVVIEGVPGHTVLLSLGHHAMVDGASGIDISLVLFDLQRAGAQFPPPDGPWLPSPLPGGGELLSEALRESMGRFTPASFLPPAAAPGHQRLLDRASSVMQRMLTLPAMTAPWNAGLVGPKRRLIHVRYDLTEFRDIRRAFGGTINDVVLAVASEAAARYLESHGEPIANQFLRIMCPVNVRREDEAGTLGNRVSAIFPRLSAEPMEIVARLRYVQGETTLIKANQEAQALELVSESGPRFPPVLMLPTLLVGTPFDPTALQARMPGPVAPRIGFRPPLVGFNFTCTNVPGVQTAQYLAGHEILDMYGMLMLGGNLGFGIVVCSYNRRLYFNLTCDPRLMPDPERMLGMLDDAFRELHAAALAANTANAAG